MGASPNAAYGLCGATDLATRWALGDNIIHHIPLKGLHMNDDLTAAFTTTFGNIRPIQTNECAVAWTTSPVGPLLLACTAHGLCWLEFTDASWLAHAKQHLRNTHGEPVASPEHPLLVQTRSELAEYFAGQRRMFTVPLDLAGTAFQQAVWNNLLKIPYGTTWSYQDLAIAAKKAPTACRAVGQANGRNPVAIIVPCHRVINKGGGLGGYAGELWRKEKLLALEGVRATL
jgi:O-6-methylguanine DNA methyltransferase